MFVYRRVVGKMLIFLNCLNRINRQFIWVYKSEMNIKHLHIEHPRLEGHWQWCVGFTDHFLYSSIFRNLNWR
jgi:hypothetical protein